jgi:hypothetical protein
LINASSSASSGQSRPGLHAFPAERQADQLDALGGIILQLGEGRIVILVIVRTAGLPNSPPEMLIPIIVAPGIRKYADEQPDGDVLTNRQVTPDGASVQRTWVDDLQRVQPVTHGAAALG